jgi:hypothetical protein
MFKHYKNKVENQLNNKIKIIRSDKGEEYKTLFGEFVFQNSIIYAIYFDNYHN